MEEVKRVCKKCNEEKSPAEMLWRMKKKSQGLGGGGRPLGRYLVMGVRNREERKRDKGKKRRKGKELDRKSVATGHEAPVWRWKTTEKRREMEGVYSSVG